MSQNTINNLEKTLNNGIKENLDHVLGELLTPYLSSFTDIRFSSTINSYTKRLSVAINEDGYIYIAPYNELIIKKVKNYTLYTKVGIEMRNLGYEIFYTK
jgi:hypothetical protein